MPRNYWIRKGLILTAAALVLTCAFGLAAFGVSTPEPGASAALGPDWQCSRLIFVFTTCSRIKRSQAVPVALTRFSMCGRLRT